MAVFIGSMHFKRTTGDQISFFIIIVSVLLSACNGSSKRGQDGQPGAEGKAVRPSFMSVKNRMFTEVRREFNTGYCFSENGYQVEPVWHLSFPSDDSVHIFDPRQQRFVNAPVIFDHDSVFNVGWNWLRLKKLTRDSIIFQVLNVRSKAIENDNSVVFMKLYADDYIKNVLHTNLTDLRKPTRRDTLFVKRRIAEAERDTMNVFAARQQAVLTSRTNLLTISRTPVEDDGRDKDRPDESYLLPEYDVTIFRAYDDFNYSFSMQVDKTGKLHFLKSRTALSAEFADSKNRVMRAIVDGYLNAYLSVKPGSTLGIKHGSIVVMHVSGKKSRK